MPGLRRTNSNLLRLLSSKMEKTTKRLLSPWSDQHKSSMQGKQTIKIGRIRQLMEMPNKISSKCHPLLLHKLLEEMNKQLLRSRKTYPRFCLRVGRRDPRLPPSAIPSASKGLKSANSRTVLLQWAEEVLQQPQTIIPSPLPHRTKC